MGEPYATVLRGVNFGSPSQKKMAYPKIPGPKNRRAEMWDRSKEWLELPEGVQLPDMDALQADATAPRIKPLITGDFLIESKDEMKKRGVRSPDLWDAVILTFAEIERIVTAESRSTTNPTTASAAPTAPAAARIVQHYSGSENSWMG